MSIAGERNTIGEVVDGKPDGNQVWMAIERDRHLNTEGIMQQFARYTKIDQTHAGAHLRSQVGRPALRLWIIGANAKSIGSAYSNIDQVRLRCLLYHNRIRTRRPI